MRDKWRQRIFGAVCLLGFLLMLGTVGAGDQNMIPLSQIAIQLAFGMVLFAGGGYLGGFMR